MITDNQEAAVCRGCGEPVTEVGVTGWVASLSAHDRECSTHRFGEQCTHGGYCYERAGSRADREEKTNG